MGILHKKIGLDNEITHIKTKVYDVVNKKLLGEFDTRRAAADFAGVDPSNIKAYVVNKSKCRKNKLNTIITFR